MAFIRFLPPFNKITETDTVHIDVKDIRDLSNKLVASFGKKIDLILDSQGQLSQSIVILVNRRNAHTLNGADTVLNGDSEVIILPYIYGG